MKHLTQYVTVFMLALFLFSCNQDKIKELESEKEVLTAKNDFMDQKVKKYLATFDEIEQNLEKIKEREKNINLKASDNVEMNEENLQKQIVSDIQAINQLMLENDQKLAQLQEDLGNENSNLKNMVARLNERITSKDSEIATLKTNLEKLNVEKEALAKNVNALSYTVDTLENKSNLQEKVIAVQDERIKEQQSAMNQGFIAVGTFDELEKKKIVQKEGGVLGLGRIETLHDDLNNSEFKEVDISSTGVIPLKAKDVEFVTNHPSDSYELTKNQKEEIEQLVILKPDEFWKSSKYLVVMID